MLLQSLLRPVLRPIMMGVMSVTGSRRAWTPAALFTPGTAGFCGGMSVTEAFNAGLMFQDSAGTTPAALEMPVGLVLGQVGGIDASQTTSTKRPTLKDDGSGHLYLEFDGTDDCLVTPSIDLTGTDAMTVFWGGYQPNNNLGMVYELGVYAYQIVGGSWLSTNYNVSGYNYVGLGGAGANIWNIEARGAITPPAYAVVTGQTILDAVDPDGSGTIRVNGVAGTPAPGPLGVAPLGNNALCIGARDQSSLFFNGRMYTLPIIVGRAVEPALIAEVEAHINAAMGGIY